MLEDALVKFASEVVKFWVQVALVGILLFGGLGFFVGWLVFSDPQACSSLPP